MEMINWHTFFFLLFALVACWFAIAVVLSANIVRMAFYLVVALGAVAGLFFLAGASFLGAMQLLVYVGGTLVLLAFGVMLTARGPFVSIRTGGGQWIMAAIIGASLLAVLVQAALSVKAWAGPQVAQNEAVESGATRLGLGLLGVRVDRLDKQAAAADDPRQAVRTAGMSGYLLPFEIVSIHLLVVLIGAAYLARARRRVSE